MSVVYGWAVLGFCESLEILPDVYENAKSLAIIRKRNLCRASVLDCRYQICCRPVFAQDIKCNPLAFTCLSEVAISLVDLERALVGVCILDADNR